MVREQHLNRIGLYVINTIKDAVQSFREDQLEEIQFGGKIILPARVLQRCMNFANISSPLIFKLVKGPKRVFCGAISFEGLDGQVLVPKWMLEQLNVEAGTSVTLFAVIDALPVGLRVVFQPQSVEFLSINNPRAVLERTLRNYACISLGDRIRLPYNGSELEILVRETNSNRTINITECDLRVDFMPPPGYQDESIQEPQEQFEETFAPFSGLGTRVDGRPLSERQNIELASHTATPERKVLIRGVPNYNYQFGLLNFRRRQEDVMPPPMQEITPEPSEPEDSPLPFGPRANTRRRIRWFDTEEEVIHVPLTRYQARQAIAAGIRSVIPFVTNGSSQEGIIPEPNRHAGLTFASNDSSSELNPIGVTDSDEPPPLVSLFDSLDVEPSQPEVTPQSPISQPPNKKRRRNRKRSTT